MERVGSINFCVLALCYFVMTFGVLVGTRGLALFAAPVLLPWLTAAMGVSVFTTWLVMIPGAFYGIQVIRSQPKSKKDQYRGGCVARTAPVHFSGGCSGRHVPGREKMGEEDGKVLL